MQKPDREGRIYEKMFQKILIANRGEIAVRIIRACREMDIRTVAVYSEADREALHTQLADEAICIGPAPAKDSYLHMERILSAAVVSGAQAIHPGFGFLSENSKFTRMCEECGITFIGPDSRMMLEMGDKSRARATMEKAGIPVIPGGKAPVQDVEAGKIEAAHIGYPVMIKAALGGGGKGMRVAENEEEFTERFQTAQKEAQAAFGDGTMYLERYIRHPRHIEVQILADSFGNTVYLGNRDCSVQRRHQKVLEEAPSPALNDVQAKEIGETAVRAAKAVGYVNAGTLEFLLDASGAFFFMEMNTRIQVEHPVTEMITGLDLIQEQIRIAAGLPLSVRQEDIVCRGHAIECRINAEDPQYHFRPSPGTISYLYLPGGRNVRIDSAVYPGCVVQPFYDSMLVKIIVHGENRQEAIRRMKRALGEVVLEGITTNVDFLYEILENQVFEKGEADTGFLEEQMGIKG